MICFLCTCVWGGGACKNICKYAFVIKVKGTVAEHLALIVTTFFQTAKRSIFRKKRSIIPARLFILHYSKIASEQLAYCCTFKKMLVKH